MINIPPQIKYQMVGGAVGEMLGELAVAWGIDPDEAISMAMQIMLSMRPHEGVRPHWDTLKRAANDGRTNNSYADVLVAMAMYEGDGRAN